MREENIEQSIFYLFCVNWEIYSFSYLFFNFPGKLNLKIKVNETLLPLFFLKNLKFMSFSNLTRLHV